MPYRPFDEMCSIAEEKDTGVLWAINRYLLHPRGYALTFHFDEEHRLLGWSVQGDGGEVYTFSETDDDDGFARFEAFLNGVRIENRAAD